MSACSVAACSLSFYKRRLRAPLALLRDASQRIAQNDLDFHVAYDRADELGRLCAAFERMRAALEQNERAAGALPKNGAASTPRSRTTCARR